jgi:hypothetical protein
LQRKVICLKYYCQYIVAEKDDLFQEVKLKKPLYNELKERYYMDQHQKQMRAILDDGEISDEVWESVVYNILCVKRKSVT